MTFKDEFQTIIDKIIQNKIHITNEQSTKQSFIIPFISMLGYDTSNPLEVYSEYSAGFDKTREKVDYAIFKNSKIVIFIEAKAVYDPLKSHDPQISKYFNSTPEAKFVILTNGVKYKFYSDLSQPNIIDTTPFFELDFENVKPNDIETLQLFSKETFEVGSLVSFAEKLAYTSKLKPEIINLLRNPSDEFIKLLIKKHVDGAKLTLFVIARYRNVVKNAITDAMLEMFRQGIVHGVPVVVQPQSNTAVNTTSTKVVPATSPPINTKNSKPTMKTLFEWELIKAGDNVYFKNSLEEKAVVIDDKTVNYKGNTITFNQWGQQVKGWKSICIYDWLMDIQKLPPC